MDEYMSVLRAKDSNGNWINIPGLKGDTGEPFRPLGIYATAAALEAAVTDPDVGDVYLVGTTGAYDIYLYLADGWHNTGRYMPKGDQGDPAPQAAVTSAVNAWLAANVDPASGYVLDRSLTQENAAAPADMLGDSNRDIASNKNEVFGGEIHPNFELGIVYLDDQWKYLNSNQRIRLPQGKTIHLQKGSTVELTDYSSADFSVGWKIDGVISGWSGWITTKFTASVEADYNIAVKSVPAAAQTSPDALAALVTINCVNIFEKQEVIRLYDEGNVVFEENTIPGWINPVGWRSNDAGSYLARVTGFIPTTEGEEWTAYLRSVGYFRITFSCYSQAKDGNSAFISQTNFDDYYEDGDYRYGFAKFTIPSGCTFIRVHFYTTGLNNYYLYNTTKKDPNGLLGLKGYYESKVNSASIEAIRDANTVGIIGADKEIDLTSYTPINYHLESGRWEASTVWRGILIPREDLSFSVDFVADGYRCTYAFLKSDTISVGDIPGLCVGEKVTTIAAGNSAHRKVPDDCEFLYVYISNGTSFGQFHVINKSLKYDFDIVRKNAHGVAYISDVDQILRTIKHRHDGNQNTFSGTNVSDNLLVLAQISDVHSDPVSYSRFISFLNDNTDVINAGIVSGDLVDHGADSQYELMIACESALASDAMLIKCLGNHEMQSSKTQSETYSAYNLDTNTGKSYYYVDFQDQNIRVICLDQYDTTSSDGSIRQKTAHYSQTQIDWFINTLKDSITNGYSVIVVFHSCNEVGFPTYNESGFCQDRTYSMFPSPTSGTIISDIVDAFQHGSSLNSSYEVTDLETTLSVNTSFDTKGTFICFICGHEHIDYVGYSAKYPEQLICIIQGGVVQSQSRDESTAHWQSMYDTPRVPNTSTHDSFNVYGIDTVSRLVKIVKIGSTLTDKFIPRSFATFRY